MEISIARGGEGSGIVRKAKRGRTSARGRMRKGVRGERGW